RLSAGFGSVLSRMRTRTSVSRLLRPSPGVGLVIPKLSASFASVSSCLGYLGAAESAILVVPPAPQSCSSPHPRCLPECYRCASSRRQPAATASPRWSVARSPHPRTPPLVVPGRRPHRLHRSRRDWPSGSLLAIPTSLLVSGTPYGGGLCHRIPR